MDKIDLKTYYGMLARHDWGYHRIAGDTEAYKRLDAERLKLQKISYQSPEHMALYLAWERYGLTGDPEDKPKEI